MPKRKADITFNTLIKVLEATESEPQMVTNLIKSLEKIIPVRRSKKMQKADPNIDRLFLIKRINYDVVAKVIRVEPTLSMYEATIISVVDYNKKTKSKTAVGDTLLISKRELELTGKKQA